MSEPRDTGETHPDAAMSHLGREIDQVSEQARRRFEPGGRAVFIAGAVLVLLLAVALPFVGRIHGWEVLSGQDTRFGVAGIIPRVFLVLALCFGAAGSLVALSVRRYGAAWITSLGCDLAVVSGALAIWSQQTSASKVPGPGPGAGMVLALIAVVVLAIVWAGITWTRRPDQLAADQARAARAENQRSGFASH